MEFQDGFVELKGLILSTEKVHIGKATENRKHEEYIILYRGTTFTKAKEYMNTKEATAKCKLLTTLYAGQFHTLGSQAAYFSRSRELAESYAVEAAKHSNGKTREAQGDTRGPVGCSCHSRALEKCCTCDSQPESGGLLIFKVPAHYFHSAMIWNEACVQWMQWVYGNRNGDPPGKESVHFDTAPIVEGPCAETHGNTPGGRGPRARKARDGTVMTQVCIKCPDVLRILARCKDVVVEEIKI